MMATETVITDAGTVEKGDKVRVRLHRGELACEVMDKKEAGSA